MKKSQAFVLGALGLLAVVVLFAIGSISLSWPWENVDLNTRDTDVTYAAPARVISVEPIALDCRARIHAEVPVEGKQEHRLLGQVYRTDTVGLVAQGDVDTCVQADQVEIVETGAGEFSVTIPASAIEFVRPRVDAEATQDSVYYDQGLLGKIGDVFPWVSDNSELVPAAYTFAQSVIGGSDCMEAAYEVTREAIITAYQEQLAGQAASSDRVEVTIEGEPDFSQHDLPEDLSDFDFTVDDGAVVCEVAIDAAGGAEGADPADQ